MLAHRLTIAVVVLCATAVPTALAGEPATVHATVRVAEGFYPVTGDTPYQYASEPCAISITLPRKVSAHDALATARGARCVSSYEVDVSSGAAYLVCVEGRCEDLGYYWAIYRNGSLTCEGLDEILVSDTDEITFSYEPYPTALALASCEIS
ncbi:MAG TPA: hypothetical protein VM262_01010 [Acidimicrobiales bacterium]|nr:hypothetical protein [Acidimicrobiales bacterium]